MNYIKSSKRVQKSSPPSAFYIKKINIHNNEIFHVRFAIMQKNTEETCKKCDKSKKPGNTAILAN